MESQNIHVYLKIKIIAQKLADPSSIPQEKLELHVTNKRNYYNCQKRIKRYSKKKIERFGDVCCESCSIVVIINIEINICNNI